MIIIVVIVEMNTPGYFCLIKNIAKIAYFGILNTQLIMKYTWMYMSEQIAINVANMKQLEI